MERPPFTSTKTVVLVNDDIVQLTSLEGLLKKGGLAVRSFEGAEAALGYLSQAAPPDLIVTDLYMPVVDGWRFCRLLRSPDYPLLNFVPILVVSATFSGEEAVRITAELGADAFMSAPVDGRHFLEQVGLLLRGEQARSQLWVLIVDDSKTLSSFLAKQFADRGYQAKIAATAGEARQRFAEDRYDVVILDYNLPDEEGDRLLVDFRRERPEVILIMITGDSHPEKALDWMKKGAAAYARKPFEPEYLIELCSKACRERALLRVEELLEQRTRELREREAQLSTTLEQQQLLLDTIPVQLWYLTDMETYGRVNQVHADFLGMPKEKMEHRRLPEFLPEEVATVCRESNVEVFTSGRAVATEKWIENAQGERRLIAITKTPRLDEKGRVEFVVCAGTDITEQRELAQQALQAQKTESLQRMAGAVAHHFNNLLWIVLGNLELVADDVKPQGNVVENINEAMRATQRAVDMGRLMTVYLGQTSKGKKRIDIGALCRETIDLLVAERAENVRIEADIAPGPLPVEANRQDLQVAIINLVTNAWESLPARAGTVFLTVARADVIGNGGSSMVHPPGWEPSGKGYVCLTVADTGDGMDRSTLERIFDPYFSTKFAGRGLGLPVGLGIVSSYGGAINVDSKPGKGSTFRVYLPIATG